MFSIALPRDRRERHVPNRPHENPWHRDVGSSSDEDRKKDLESGAGTQDVSPSGEHDGTWGEQDTGIESHTQAMEEFETLRLTLSQMSRSRSEQGLQRPRTGTSQKSRRSRTLRQSMTRPNRDQSEDVENGDPNEGVEEQEEEEEDFQLDDFMREGHLEKRVDGRSAKKLGVVWSNLTVKGAGATATSVKTLPDAILGTFGPDLFRLITRFIPQLKFGKSASTRTLIHDFSGVVRDGEMMLVLGKPGSGCSTFLKAITNNREAYADVEGDVSYGGIHATKQKKQFRGEVNYNPETDLHFASLTVWQTLKFSLMNKTKKRDQFEIPIIINALLKVFGISHTKYTLVGDEFVRGVSGGERKRVSIAETLATKSTVTCWDNSTRGLDSSTALDYTKSLRIMTDISRRTTFVTLYQAGEGIYDLMDKVLVIDTGRCIFQGSARDAKQYFVDLGYYCPDRQTTPDFLTAVTDPTERRFREGFEKSAPRGPEELEKAYRESEYYQAVLNDVVEYAKEQEESDFADAKEFEDTAHQQKSKTVLKKSVYTVSFIRQVYACTLR